MAPITKGWGVDWEIARTVAWNTIRVSSVDHSCHFSQTDNLYDTGTNTISDFGFTVKQKGNLIFQSQVEKKINSDKEPKTSDSVAVTIEFTRIKDVPGCT